jgi:hypothetical protein
MNISTENFPLLCNLSGIFNEGLIFFLLLLDFLNAILENEGKLNLMLREVHSTYFK